MQWLEAMGKWPCGDCFTFYSVVMRDDVLIEKNNDGCVIMQNNGAMKIVNFTHAQTRRSFLRPWTPGTRLHPSCAAQPLLPFFSGFRGTTFERLNDVVKVKRPVEGVGILFQLHSYSWTAFCVFGEYYLSSLPCRTDHIGYYRTTTEVEHFKLTNTTKDWLLEKKIA